jgi:endonuclease/exonuclease/phosphatase family metal-dependent hydrolase
MRPIRAIWLRTGTIVATAIASVAVLALSGGAQATAYLQTFLQFNVCGNACNSGGLGVINNLENSIRERRPIAVTLNEVCENQYASLRADLASYHGRFDPTGPICRNGARYGNAVLVRTTKVDLVGSWELPNPAGDEARRMMCLRTQLPEAPSVLVCVTHVSNVSGNLAAQLRTVAGILNELDVNNAVLLGGDLNTDPADARMNPLYSTCYGSGTGDFHEADSAGCASRSMIDARVGSDVINENTYSRHKFDYIFLSDGDWSSAGADADGANGLSDHSELWASTILPR